MKDDRAARTTRRTFEALAATGWTAWIGEHYVRGANRLRDIYGFADILVCRNGGGIWLVQAGTERDHAKHVTEAANMFKAREWRRAGGRIAIVTWRPVSLGKGVRAWKARVLVSDDAPGQHLFDWRKPVKGEPCFEVHEPKEA